MKEKIMGLKRTIMFLTTFIILLATTLIFFYVWDVYYSDSIVLPFYRKGNWLIGAIYAVLLYAFTKIYSGYKVGFLRLSEVIYSQVLSLLFVNAITYLQISLIGRQFLNVVPILGMTVVQIIIITVWALATHKVYYLVYPPRNTMLVYGSGEAGSIVRKMNLRKEKFNITSMVSAKKGVSSICAMLD